MWGYSHPAHVHSHSCLLSPSGLGAAPPAHPFGCPGRVPPSSPLPRVPTPVHSFPVLVPHHLPTFLAALADLPAPTNDEASRQEFYARLAERTTASSALTAQAGGAGEGAAGEAAAAAVASGVDSERDARVIGTCKVLKSCLGFWRVIFRCVRGNLGVMTRGGAGQQRHWDLESAEVLPCLLASLLQVSEGGSGDMSCGGTYRIAVLREALRSRNGWNQASALCWVGALVTL